MPCRMTADGTIESVCMTARSFRVMDGAVHINRRYPLSLLGYCLFGVSGMTLISQVKVLSRVVTAKCSEPQAVCSNGNRGGNGVANLSSLRTET